MSHWRAITLDLDDTLWPVWPAIERAEAALHGWLSTHAPATAEQFDTAGLRRLREQVGAEHPQQAHDLSWLRLTSIRRALQLAGDDPALAEPAFEGFLEQRQRVELYPEVSSALAQLASRRPLLALTNGNADLQRIGLAGYFSGTLSAREFGCGKPNAAFFHEACRRLDLAPDEVLHVGDDWALDIEGAHGAGLASVWVRRPGQADKPARHRARPWMQLAGLDELVLALD
jgi:2-haloalkanoic acid dehalogenase type II